MVRAASRLSSSSWPADAADLEHRRSPHAAALEELDDLPRGLVEPAPAIALGDSACEPIAEEPVAAAGVAAPGPRATLWRGARRGRSAAPPVAPRSARPAQAPSAGRAPAMNVSADA